MNQWLLAFTTLCAWILLKVLPLPIHGAYLPPPPPTHTPTHLSFTPCTLPPPQLMLTLATYINILEADKQKLKAQVKRLCAENNWLRKELTDHQQLLQETETSLAKIKEEKEHLGFLLEQQRVRCHLGSRVWIRLQIVVVEMSISLVTHACTVCFWSLYSMFFLSL